MIRRYDQGLTVREIIEGTQDDSHPLPSWNGAYVDSASPSTSAHE
jgi:hypothetical protein